MYFVIEHFLNSNNDFFHLFSQDVDDKLVGDLVKKLFPLIKIELCEGLSNVIVVSLLLLSPFWKSSLNVKNRLNGVGSEVR